MQKNPFMILLPEDMIRNSILKRRLISPKASWLTTRAIIKYRIEVLPKEIQFTCVNEILITDLNDDNYQDIILGENNYSLKPQYARFDAGFAHLLMGSEDGYHEARTNRDFNSGS